MLRNQLAALDGLKDRVMKLSRHASAFRHSFIEACAHDPRQPPHSQPIDCPNHEDDGRDIENSKPAGLVPRGCDAEVQGCVCIVPDAVIVARDHAEPVFSWTKVTVESLTPYSWILPGGIVAFQSVAKAHLLRSHKA